MGSGNSRRSPAVISPAMLIKDTHDGFCSCRSRMKLTLSIVTVFVETAEKMLDW